MTARRVLLTGAASLAGAEVLRALGESADYKSAVQLLLPSDDAIRNRQLQSLESYLGTAWPSVTVVTGDPHLPRFGLSVKAWEEFANSFDVGIHCFQRDVLDGDIERARRANLLPVENWIHLLDRNHALRLHHLSTAFIGGTRRGLLTEFDLDCGQGFHNAWERSKFEAELRLRESRVSDRVTIYRPSHLLGRSDTGAAFQFSGSYSLLATLAASKVLPGDGRARIDFIPSDYVASSIVSLMLRDATGTFHLATGWFESLTVKKAATIAKDGRGALLLPRALAWPLRLAGSSSAGHLAERDLAFTSARDLLNVGPVFDTYLADRALDTKRPQPEEWLPVVLRAAQAKQWQTPAVEPDLPAEAAPQARVETLRTHEPLGERRFHQIGDVNVAYRDVGQGEPVVFMHGFAGAHAWDGVVERIATRRRALIVETLGISETSAPASADFGLPAQAARVRGLLSALDIPTAHVVGNDTGGVIAQFFAVRWPQLVRSLTLSDCDAHGTWPPKQVALIAKLMAIPGGTWAISSFMKIPAVARSPLGLGDMVYDKKLLTDERLSRYIETVAGSSERRMRLKRFFRSFDKDDLATMNQFLSELHVPTMIVWGAENKYWSPSWARELYDAIPGARRLELIPFAGISCHEERPDVFAKVLGEFLDQIESESAVTTAAARAL
ncbi:MAG TPA: alpha/beta fold hydrolase [Thermoanaerobaculia bacterium]|nr:alpha/beta fold hydrolase [Thermoanaerobaculia bacterium]